MGTVRTAVRVEGVVQGVGFRPFVYSLATGLGLTGLVGNDTDGVFAEVEGPRAAVAEFLRRLEHDAPPLARIEKVTTRAISPARSEQSFVIAASTSGGPRRTLVSADTATCADCLRELFDPADRRHAYPFINCTNCGPRFTIVRDVPYDRPLTTMAPFAMCERCAAEYHDPADRRFHAQPDVLPGLRPPAGPRTADGERRRSRKPPASSQNGKILAVKGLGGYHLAVDAGSARRRRRAPLAQAPRGQAVRGHGRRPGRGRGAWPRSTTRPRACWPARARPIVLLRPAAGRRGSPSAVAPGQPRARGHAPVHAAAPPAARRHGPPHRADQRQRLRRADRLPRRRGAATGSAGIADAFLIHDRAIHVRTDDSVARAFRRPADAGPALPRLRPRAARRCRAASAGPCWPAAPSSRTRSAWPRGGTRSSRTTSATWRTPRPCARSPRASRTSRRLFGIAPQVVAYDLHPEYLSTKYALDLPTATGLQLAACSTTTRTSPPAWPTTAAGPGHRRRLRRHRLRHRRHDLGRRVPGRRPGGVRARRPPRPGPDAGRRGRDPAAVADGRGLPRATGRRPTWPHRHGATRWARRDSRWPPAARERPADLQRGPPVRRRRRAARRPRRDQLRGPGRDRARAARRPGGGRRVPSRRSSRRSDRSGRAAPICCAPSSTTSRGVPAAGHRRPLPQRASPR